MDYYIRDHDDTLYHYGRKGMKWGQNIFTAHKKRKQKKQRAKNLEKARQARKMKAEEAKSVEEQRAKLLKSTDANELYKHRDLLTTAEINERLTRIGTERRLEEVAAATKTSALDYVDKALKVGRKVNDVYEFTNTPVMKALKKKLGIEKAEERLGLDKIYAMRDELSDKQLGDALKRASTEKAIKKILDENDELAKKAADEVAAAERLKEAQRQVDEYLKGTYSKKGKDLTDPILNTGSKPKDATDEQLLLGQAYVAGLLEVGD